MTKSARSQVSPSSDNESRQVIWKRPIFLFAVGMLFYAVGWTGDILHYNGVYIFVDSFFYVWSWKTLFIPVLVILDTTQNLQLKDGFF
ncbi:hypothetical protein [Sporosarcina sp. NPDC096371]|uniref:hypothetical protein n=1 Tax=Sporosarcina sp. NPDC096371 TaxID=3364530 RepID=UPI00382D5D70